MHDNLAGETRCNRKICPQPPQHSASIRQRTPTTSVALTNQPVNTFQRFLSPRIKKSLTKGVSEKPGCCAALTNQQPKTRRVTHGRLNLAGGSDGLTN